MAAPRPFRVLGLQQIALGSLSRSALEHLWIALFGLESIGGFRSQSENVDEICLRLGGGPGAVEVDLMTPLDPAARPRVHEPALNHLGLWIDDLGAAVEWLAAQGVRFAPGGIRKGAAGHDVCFIHPRPSDEFPVSGQGVLIELVQAPREIIEQLGPNS